MSCAAAPMAGRPPVVEMPPVTIAAGDWSVRTGGLSAEVEALAGLLAEVVMLAGNRAVIPSRLELVADLAREHDSVRVALRTEATTS
ncbi:MAG: hypothetical protein ACRDTX_13245 [Pseudonocardiaceae bacterium]